jgi:hypothetical protein
MREQKRLLVCAFGGLWTSLTCSSGSAAMPASARAPRLARLAVKYGAEILLDDLLARLSADCPWRDDPRGRCGARFTDVPPGRPPDLPPALMRLRVVRGGKS